MYPSRPLASRGAKILPAGAQLPLLLLGLGAAACSGAIDAERPGDDGRRPNESRPGDLPKGGGSGSGGGAGGSSSPGVTPSAPGAFVPAPGGLRRLTAEEYRNSVRDLLGEPLTLPSALEPDVVLFGFTTVGAASSSVSERGIEQYDEAAFQSAAQAFGTDARRRALVGCAPTAAADPCVRAFVESFGRRAFRRPLTAVEADAFAGLVGTVATASGSVWTGLEHAVAAFLQAPSFLYRAELGEADPAVKGRRRYTGFEMASRLSYLFWATTPDGALLDAAAKGDLLTADGVRAQAKRLLEGARGRAGALRFYGELLELGKLSELQKDPAVFPNAAALGPSMRTEAEKMFEQLVFTRGADVRGLLDTAETFLNGDLAKHYGLTMPTARTFSLVTLPASGPRTGLLGTGGLLALHAHGVESAPTLRGKFVREVLLCQSVPPPPPNVSAMLPAPKPGVKQTHRQRLDAHRQDPACAGCHALMDPIGFGLEHYDALGGHRTTENGLPIDATGELDGKAFDGLRGLAAAIKGHPELVPCLAKNAYRYATGHDVTAGEQGTLDAATARFAAAGHKLPDLLTEIVASEGFRFAADPR